MKSYHPAHTLPVLALLGALLCPIHAAPPSSTINYQGRLTAAGTNFTGTGYFKFSLVNAGTNLSRQATAYASVSGGKVTSITVSDGGSGYAAPPAVSVLPFPGGGGSGAAAAAIVSGGSVTAINVTSQGSGYFAGAVVTLAAPSASYAYQTSWANNGGWDANGEPTLPVALPVLNGLFQANLGGPDTVYLPPELFLANDLQLRIWFAPGSGGPFQLLSPVQPLSAAPYAMTAAQASNVLGVLPNSGLSGGYGKAVQMTNSGNQFNGAFAGNGAGLTNLNASALASGTVSDDRLSGSVARLSTSQMFTASNVFWGVVTATNANNHFAGNGAGLGNLNAGALVSGTVPDTRLSPTFARTNQVWLLSGNLGTAAGTHFLGTADNQPLEIKINGQRALRLEPNANGAPNLLGGAAYNRARPGVVGATIAGGGATSFLGGSFTNRVDENFGTIGGGVANTISTNAYESTIAGGYFHTVQTGAYESSIGGGYLNTVATDAHDSTIAGGQGNTAGATYTTIGGGQANTGTGRHDTISGGLSNSISLASEAVISGGAFNSIFSIAADSVISGGYGNKIMPSSVWSVIGGGYSNLVDTSSGGTTVGGGYANIGGAAFTTVAGGRDNQAQASLASIGGGRSNMVLSTAYQGTIAGGFSNTLAGMAATIGGGSNNVALGLVSSVGGGSANKAFGQSSVVSGGFWNLAAGVESAVAGGYGNSAMSLNCSVGGGVGNLATNLYATVAGGHWNKATAVGAVVAGGGYEETWDLYGNQASGDNSSILGGAGNLASGKYSVVGGGYNNTASGEGAVVAGGGYAAVDYGNKATAVHSVISGGYSNRASGAFSTVAGGQHNIAGGNYSFVVGASCQANGEASFAAGMGARAQHDRSFVWSDGSTTSGLESTATCQFSALARGGVRFYTSPGYTTGVTLSSGGSSWNMVSDRNAKENFEPLDSQAVLEKVAALPITEWNLKAQDPSIRHIGPMAQDFHAAFELNGSDDRWINSSDIDGVALAAIQGLNQKLEEKNAALEKQVAELKALVETLAAKVNGGKQ